MNHLISPINRRKPLEEITLEEDLTAYQCPESKGLYLTLASYTNWLRKQPQRLENLPMLESESVDSFGKESPALLCPETNTIMLRYRVGHGFKFTIDRSQTGGIWLDAGEWEMLKARQFHDELHLVFTAPWQRKAREVMVAEQVEKRMVERFGLELYGDLKALKAKLETEELVEYRDYALAFLEHS